MTASVASVSDYYPFGLGMPGRTFSADEYRYGFNGKEKDPDGLGGGGSTYDYGFRIYNPGIAKFLSVDPLTNSYPWYTPYQFAGNKPIWAIDLDGLEEVSYTITLDVEFSKNIPEWIPFGAWSFDAEILPTGKISDYFVEEGAIANYYIIMRIPTHAVPYGNSYRITHYDTYVYSGNNLQGIKDLKNWDREPDLQWAFVNGLRAGVFSALLYDFLNQTQVQSESPNSSEPESDAPNPYGSKDKPDHQKKVEDDNERLTREYKDDSERTVLREQKVQGHDLRRYPDNQIVKDGKTEKIIERERNPNSPYVRGKEKDYQKHNIPYEIWDLNKNVPIRSWSPQ